MFSYISPEVGVQTSHPLLKLRALVDELLATRNSELDALNARRVRPSIPPETLLKAFLLEILSLSAANKTKRTTVGLDRRHDCKAFPQGSRIFKVNPHVATKDKHSAVVSTLCSRNLLILD